MIPGPMKRYILIIASALLIAGCSNKDKFTIEGVIKGEKKNTIYLNRLEIDTPVLTDSAKVDSKGRFRLRVRTAGPDFYQLGWSESDFITLLAAPGEKIKIESEGRNLFEKYSVSGSEGSSKIKYLDETLERTKKSLDSLSTLYRELSAKPGFDAEGAALEDAYNKLIMKQRSKNIEFIISNTTSLASVKAVYQKLTPEAYVLYDPKDLQFLKILSDSLGKYYPGSKQVQALAMDFQKELNQMYANRLGELTKNMPVTKLDPELSDVNGKRISLSSLKGKYVLLSFWSVRSAECVNENLRLKELYKTYRNRGFEIYQVNLDQDENLWKRSVSFDELPWISTREDDPANPKYARLFNVQSLPSNYLFDRDGDIIAVNLHNRALAIKLEQLFK
jgi:hypothetical protein